MKVIKKDCNGGGSSLACSAQSESARRGTGQRMDDMEWWVRLRIDHYSYRNHLLVFILLFLVCELWKKMLIKLGFGVAKTPVCIIPLPFTSEPVCPWASYIISF